MKNLLLAAAASIAVVPALAQTPAAPTAPPAPQVAPVPPAPPAPPAPMFREHSRDEVVAKVREHFAKLDTNRDGFLTREEAKAGHAAMTERWQRHGIGHALNVKRADPAAAFDRIDTNNDGSISREEFAKGHERRIERVVVNQMPGAPAAVPPAPPAPHAPMLRMHRFGGMIGGHMFERADANKDNRVSLQEATDAAVRHFDMADANRDGRITPDERRVIHRQIIEKHRAPKG